MLNKLLKTSNSRNIAIQIILLISILAIGYYLFNNALSNLQRQGIASGFAFLSNPAGFDIIMHLIDYNEKSTYFDALIVGLLNTLLLSLLGIIFATIIGFIIGIGRLSENWLVAKLTSLYIEIFRNIPLLLQIFFWYFAVLRNLPTPKYSLNISDIAYFNIRGLYLPKPDAIHLSTASFIFICSIAAIFLIYQFFLYYKKQQIAIFSLIIALAAIFSIIILNTNFEIPTLKTFNFEGGIVIIPELMAMLIALTVYTASFIAEIVRSGILSIEKGQIEAAKSLGLSTRLTTRLIIIPQALRVIIPPLTSQYLNLTKNTSLAAAIAYPDLVSVFAGTVLNQTGQAIEVIGITMAIYLSISLIISLLMNWYNKKMSFKT